MIGRLTRVSILAAAAILTAVPAEAQERFRVLVPDFYAPRGTRRNFGRDAAEVLRDLLNTLRTHAPIERRAIDRAADEVDLDMEDLDCIKTRQLATQIDANVALCATYTEADETREITGIQFWDIGIGEALDVPAITVSGQDADKEAAQQIFAAFDRMVQLARAQQFCAEYATSQQWDNALTNCVQALDLNPGAIATRMRKSRIHFEQAREGGIPEAEKSQYFQQALEEIDTVLEGDPFHEEALQLAGFVAIQLGDEDRGRGYYSRYLEVNPGADQVRLNIAYDMAEAGDPEGAMGLVRQGLETAPENTELLTSYATYAYAAADKRVKEVRASDAGAAVPPEAANLYREVINNLNKVAAIRGAETPAQNRRTVIASHLQIGEAADAQRVAQELLATEQNDEIALSFLADAQHRQGRLDDAIATVSRIGEVNPDQRPEAIQIRQGNWLMEVGRVDDGLGYFRQAVERGMDANQVARIVFGDAVNRGVRQENWPYAIRGLTAAKSFQVDAATRSEFEFWHGWSLYHQGMALQQPQTLESARAALPVFEQARDLFNAGRAAASRSGVNIQQLLDAVNQYIEIQEVIIRRYG